MEGLVTHDGHALICDIKHATRGADDPHRDAVHDHDLPARFRLGLRHSNKASSQNKQILLFKGSESFREAQFRPRGCMCWSMSRGVAHCHLEMSHF